MKYRIVRTRKYTHGYETRCVLQTDQGEDLRVYMIGWGSKEPTAKEITAEADKRLPKWEANYLEPEEKPVALFTEDEVTEILREKKVLEADETFSPDMPEKIEVVKSV